MSWWRAAGLTAAAAATTGSLIAAAAPTQVYRHQSEAAAAAAAAGGKERAWTGSGADSASMQPEAIVSDSSPSGLPADHDEAGPPAPPPPLPSGGEREALGEEGRPLRASTGDAETSPASDGVLEEKRLTVSSGGERNIDDDDDDDDEEETCGFCIFMKGGPCKREFVAWSKCVDKERKDGGDFTAECQSQTMALQSCMQANTDYYGPMLEAEKEYAERQDAEDDDI